MNFYIGTTIPEKNEDLVESNPVTKTLNATNGYTSKSTSV